MQRTFRLGLDLDDDSDGVAKTDSDELGEAVGHGGGEKTGSALLGKVVEEPGKGGGETEVEETEGRSREDGLVSITHLTPQE